MTQTIKVSVCVRDSRQANGLFCYCESSVTITASYEPACISLKNSISGWYEVYNKKDEWNIFDLKDKTASKHIEIFATIKCNASSDVTDEKMGSLQSQILSIVSLAVCCLRP